MGARLPASAGSTAVNQFLGLPFAHASRWEPPRDFEGKYSTQPYNATMWGSACLQVLTENTTYGTEDCLMINVWQPATAKPGDDLPVLVFVYGGSNQFGEAEPYNMSALSAFHNTICVNFNYRTGPIGWMAFDEDAEGTAPTGNWGILDIQSALRWVQREIPHFGGDSTRVAIHGQSSGGGLVELQYVAPGSHGLLHAVLSESGGLSATPLKAALRNARAAAASVGCVIKHSGHTNKSCMTALPDVTITNLTNGYNWGPVVDGITFPANPMEMLRNGSVNPVSVVFGAQTNDSFLFLSQDYTRGYAPQPNDYPDGHLEHLTAKAYVKAVKQMLDVSSAALDWGDSVTASLLERVLALYPAAEVPGGSVVNVHSLGRIEADQMHCGLRQRAAALEKARAGSAFVYRFNYWYQSNKQCTAVPNYHRDYLGAVHQDEVTFVLGQPNFMEDGSCCGKWGLSEGQEGCSKLKRCTACYDPTLGEGYKAYFNDKEFAFARRVGEFWTNTAATGNPNQREGNPTSMAATGTNAWPPAAQGGIVLDALLPGGFKTEKDLYDNPAICKLWDSL